MRRSFVSDNNSTVHPAVLAWIASVNVDHAPGYARDGTTVRCRELFHQAFDHELEVYFVSTGTAANMLAIRLLISRGYEAVLAAETSHLFADETGAPTALMGVPVFPLPDVDGKLSIAVVEEQLGIRGSSGFRAVVPRVLTISNPTEYGVVYTPEEVRALADFCHDNNMFLHVDGSRLANAAVELGVTLAELTADCNVDALSFGGAKNGLMCAEAVVVFRAPASDGARYHAQFAHATSKMRFLSAQFIPYLADGLWRANALNANRLARTLATGLEQRLGPVVSRPLQTNHIFATLSAEHTSTLNAAGHNLLQWPTGETRLVVSWDNTDEDVQEFLTLL